MESDLIMVYATGDMHGDYALFSQKKFKNLKEGDTLVVCGDFGFIWRGDSKEKKILDKGNSLFSEPVHA